MAGNESIKTTIRWKPEEIRHAKTTWTRIQPYCPTFSSYARQMILLGKVVVRKSFVNPTRIVTAINRLGRNVDDLLRLARNYGIEPGEIQSLADQSRRLNDQLDKWWTDYEKSRNGRP